MPSIKVYVVDDSAVVRAKLDGCVCVLGSAGVAADSAVTWLVRYDGKTAPQTQGWKPVGALASEATIVDGGLRVNDASETESGAFRATSRGIEGDFLDIHWLTASCKQRIHDLLCRESASFRGVEKTQGGRSREVSPCGLTLIRL